MESKTFLNGSKSNTENNKAIDMPSFQTYIHKDPDYKRRRLFFGIVLIILTAFGLGGIVFGTVLYLYKL